MPSTGDAGLVDDVHTMTTCFIRYVFMSLDDSVVDVNVLNATSVS
jgi:hypothetical protein